VAHRPHDRELRLAAKSALQRPAVRFDATQIEAVAAGIGNYVAKSQLPVFACSVMPDHVHLVIANTQMKVEQRTNLIKGAATTELLARGIHPFEDQRDKDGKLPQCFVRGEWKVFLNSEEDVLRAIRYVENNPLKERLPPQRWGFVRLTTPRVALPFGSRLNVRIVR
jgi:REP element-mobilizing transposase RayT